MTRLETPGAVHASELARQASAACLQSLDPPPEAVRSLCELATSADPMVARTGTSAIFGQVIERLGDSFEPRACDLYVRFFAELLNCCQSLPGGARLRERLHAWGLASRAALVERAVRLRHRLGPPGGRVRKVLVLSRVTLGADVAITSIFLAKMRRLYPEADLVLVGGPKAGLLFAGGNRLRLLPVAYPRGGVLLDRLDAWIHVAAAVADEVAGLPPGDYLVLDPDSRLTQLGMLPVAPQDAAYYFFESRSYRQPGHETLAGLSAAWLAERFGPDLTPLYPWVSPPGAALARAAHFRATRTGPRWVAINLGIGDNPRKGLGEEFEGRLLASLLAAGWHVLLDRGDGAGELARSERLLAQLQTAGHRLAEWDEEADRSGPADAAVVAWRGSLAGFAALLGSVDLYAGYDSAGQHLAAALGVPTIDIFAGFQSPLMAQRWKPAGPAPVSMIVVNEADRADLHRVLERVLEATR